jgi:Leucine-rich repeat (LRR) protein
MRSSASQVTPLAAWGARHRIEAAQLDRIRHALDSGESDLDLSEIGVSAVPSFLRDEDMLRSLTLRFAAAESIHIDVALLPRLRALHIVGGEMQNLTVTGTESLRVHDNARCMLAVAESPLLATMKMCTNTFDTLHVWDAPRLRVLDVSASRLRRLAVLNAEELEQLDASMNPLLDEDLELSGVNRLATLRLALGRLLTVPRAVREATALRELDLRGNLITAVRQADLPPCLALLDLSNNNVSAVSFDWACCARLRDLRLAMNRIASVSSAIGLFRRLETLDLSHNDIDILPAAIGRCTLLRVLKLASNRLLWLPPEICQLTALEMLDLDQNGLTALPEEMDRLTRLECLLLQGNALSSLPDRLDQLPLRRLILDGNQDISLDGPLLREHTQTGQPSFAALAALDLGHTRLVALPPGLGFRRELVQLRLHENLRLRDLPDDLSELHRLRWLDLTRCGFRRLPAVLARMSASVLVNLPRNPLSQPRSSGQRSPEAATAGGAWVGSPAPRQFWCVAAEVRIWRGLAGQTMTREQEAYWNESLLFRNSDSFAYLLVGLRSLPEYWQSSAAGQAQFSSDVGCLLVDIEAHPGLSASIFDETEMNTATLANHHRLSFDRLALTARLHSLARDRWDRSRTAAMLMRDAYRREAVARIAALNAQASATHTEVELDLDYRILLSRAPGGFSFNCGVQADEQGPRLDSVEADNIIAVILSAERNELVDYMCVSPVWRSYLTHSRALAYQTIIADFDANIDAGFSGDAQAGEHLAPELPTLLAQREQAVFDWSREETVALLTDNSLLPPPA